ncbi:hypothetical protein CEXT_642431 [Caerostris extrusa]|uniref:Uncharacterized protein n=1 Tax=Caerostris extrusa TaxID=172846 RepID=A0AAV4V7G4_CAEEX|nr:hypothetical protein CEXT_642431 [Caerostris extrusa]
MLSPTETGLSVWLIPQTYFIPKPDNGGISKKAIGDFSDLVDGGEKEKCGGVMKRESTWILNVEHECVKLVDYLRMISLPRWFNV